MKNSTISTIIEVHTFDFNNNNVSFTTEDAEKAIRHCAGKNITAAHMYLVDSHERQNRIAIVDVPKSIATARELQFGFDGLEVVYELKWLLQNGFDSFTNLTMNGRRYSNDLNLPSII